MPDESHERWIRRPSTAGELRIETHLSVTADHSPVKTVQRSVYDHLGIDWVQRFQSIPLDFKRKSRL